MKIRAYSCASVLLLAGLTCRIFGQALPTATGPGTLLKVGGGYSVYHLQYGQRYLGGAQVWADTNIRWFTGLEFEARRLRQNQDLGTYADTYLAGPRISLRPHALEPYVKVLGGVGRFHFPYNDARGNYFVIAPGTGVDLHVGSRLHLRLIDIEYQEWPRFTFGPMSSFGVSTGISIVLLRGPTRLSD